LIYVNVFPDSNKHLFWDTDLLKGETAENRIFPGCGEPKTKDLRQRPKTRHEMTD
jgi:hypothetical protein